ncbi:hypothetical protein Tco_0107191 [Tanacetum coccineum]
MEDEHLETIPSVENLVLIPSEFKSIFDDTCDMLVDEDSSTFDALSDHSEILSDSNNDGTSSDDNDFEDIEYIDASPPDSELVSLEKVNDIDQEEKDFDLEDILQIQDVILHEKLLSINRLIANIESLKDNPSPDYNYLPEFETFSDHTEETRSGSTTTHANNSLPEYDSFHFDPSFPRPPPEPPDVEILEHENNNFDVLNNDESFDQRGSVGSLIHTNMYRSKEI